ncbi:MAG: HAMP domain-containing sensor histidine kinase [Hyphomicrobiaceae bacterium]|nr:HAMP domain-containing sensor histidine kinase [Hyphomicrobiaceae bacterium]
MGEYSLKLGEAVLRSRTMQAEKAARHEAEIAARIKSEFISNMSHELRTPLNTVIGFSKLLTEHDKRPLTTDDIVEYARLIHDAAGNLLSIINDILDMSKIQSGHFRLHTGDVNVDEVLEAIVMSLRNQATAAGVTLSLELPSEAVLVRGDSQKLKQVFANLIGNAVKFTAAGGKVTIGAEVEGDGAVRVVVQDDGIGMNDEEVELALAPFGQVDGSRSRWREGTGLGLPIAKALIELHGGSLEIVTAKSVGTTVTVHLPPPDFVAAMQQGIGIRVGAA